MKFKKQKKNCFICLILVYSCSEISASFILFYRDCRCIDVLQVPARIQESKGS